MAFFGSNGYERNLKRSYSTDRLRRERPAGARSVSKAQSPTNTTELTDELGFVNNSKNSSTSSSPAPEQARADRAPGPSSRNPSASASLASSSLNPSTSTSAGPSASLSKQRQAGSSGRNSQTSLSASRGNSRQGSGSSSPNRRRSPDLTDESRNSPAGANDGTMKRGDPVAHARSSPDLKERPRNRTKSGVVKDGAKEKGETNLDANLSRHASNMSVSGRLRGPRPLVRPSSSRANISNAPPSDSPSSTDANGTLRVGVENSLSPPRTAEEASNKSSDATSRQRKLSNPRSSPVAIASCKQHDDSNNNGTPAAQSKATNSTNTRNTAKSSTTNGHASDSSYGSPLSELGVVGGFNVKRLLACPAGPNAHGNSNPSGVRSEPDTDYGSASLTATRRQLSASHIPLHSPSVYSVTSGLDKQHSPVKASSWSKRPTTSEPESEMSYGSLGRARGLEWGHILSKNKTKDTGPEHGTPTGHVREQSASFSLSSPSEGTSYQYGRAIGREKGHKGSIGSRPIIQLTTSAVKRFSALGMREADRSYSTGPTPYSNTSPSPTSALSTFASKINASINANQAGYSSAETRSKQHRGTKPSNSNKEKESVSVSRRADSPPPVGLTPSELIMHQYKQQERRRQELEKGATRDVEQPEKVPKQGTVREKSTKPKDKSKQTAMDLAAADHDENAGAYYSIFGDDTGKMFSIGNPRDSAFGLFERGNEKKAMATEKAVVAEMGTPGHTTAMSVDAGLSGALVKEGDVPHKSVRRKLSRKMSSRFANGRKEAGEDSGVMSADESWVRPSTSSASTPLRKPDLERVQGLRTVKMSLDSYVAVPESIGRMLPSASNGNTKHLKPFDRSASESAASKLAVPGLTNGDKDKGKIWGFVKRISSNTLKDKYKRSSAEIIPPVPEMPGKLMFDLEKEKSSAMEANKPRAKSRPTHIRRPSTAPALSEGRILGEGRFTTLRKKSSMAQVLQEARSSSPSSDNGSSFKFRMSNDSSTSSLGDAPKKPASNAPLVQHILPPETLHMLEEFDARYSESALETPNPKQKPTADSSNLFYGFPSDDETNHQALPVPPRRAAAATPASSRSESPTIPTFTADNAINTFGFNKRNRTNTEATSFTGEDFGRRSLYRISALPSGNSRDSSPSGPPPRPPRSARRGQSIALTSSQASENSHSSSPANTNNSFDPRTSFSAASQASTCRPDVTSYRTSHSTSPMGSPSPPELLDGLSPISASDSASSAVTFRDIAGAAAKPLLSEKEKLDKWNDLLVRSDKAGGTLHVGVAGLLSDQMRDSTLEPIRDSFAFSDY